MRAHRLLFTLLGALTLSADSHPTANSVTRYRVKLAPTVDRAAWEQQLGMRLGGDWVSQPTGMPGQYRLTRVNGVERLDTSSGPGTKWDMAHRLRETRIFEWAEPAFRFPLEALEAASGDPGECAPAWTGGWKDPNDPVALGDSEWSLKELPGANVKKAWELIENEMKVAAANAGITLAAEDLARLPGRGIAVGHPDTGYLPHPSIAESVLKPGFDFVGRSNDARDYSEAGPFQWPGHGTRTSSVILGARDFSVGDGAVRKISGVAPGAMLMPMKVAHRVVLLGSLDFDFDNLAMAIRAAAIGDPNFVAQPANVVSISLGGVANSRTLQEALKIAASHNVIVLAAAGNNVPVRQIVFPARYPNVIAVAASNSQSKPWSGTSKGRQIAISAPGQNVWTARVRYEGETAYTCVEVGTGTSYAVATTAGVAALWLSHKADALKKTRLSHPEIFRHLVRDTAGRPSVWDPDKLGPGIVDAEKLLKASLPETLKTNLLARAPCDDVEAVATLFDADPVENARRLFGFEGDAMCRSIEQLGDELAFWFATDPAVATAFDGFHDSARDPRAFRRLRQAILDRPISSRLRARLVHAQHRDLT